jgi:hypothetical protein
MYSNEILKNPKGREYGYVELYKAIDEWSQFNKRVLETILAGNPDIANITLKRLKDYHAKWLEALIIDYSFFSTQEDMDGVSVMPSVSIFVELCRSHFLITYPRIIEESENVKRTQDLKQDLLILFSMKKTDHFPTNREEIKWELPVMQFKQSDIINLLVLITEKLDSLPHGARPELVRVLEACYTRNSVLFCEPSDNDTLDVEKMRLRREPEGNYRPNYHYMCFVTIYFIQCYRRLYYSEIIAPLHVSISPGAHERVRAWVEKEVCTYLGDSFGEIWHQSYEEAYRFPGDYAWFELVYPKLKPQPGPVLECFRMYYAKSLYTSYRLSIETVMGSVELETQTGHAARLFVINAIDRYMQTRYNLEWKDRFVVKNEDLEGAETRLIRNQAPFLVQVLSRYVVYHDGRVVYTDSLYETLTYWFQLLKTKYKDDLFPDLTVRLIDGKEKPTIRKIE